MNGERILPDGELHLQPRLAEDGRAIGAEADGLRVARRAKIPVRDDQAVGDAVCHIEKAAVDGRDDRPAGLGQLRRESVERAAAVERRAVVDHGRDDAVRLVCIIVLGLAAVCGGRPVGRRAVARSAGRRERLLPQHGPERQRARALHEQQGAQAQRRQARKFPFHGSCLRSFAGFVHYVNTLPGKRKGETRFWNKTNLSRFFP